MMIADDLRVGDLVEVHWHTTGECMAARVVTICAGWCEVVDADDHIYRIDYDRTDVEPLRFEASTSVTYVNEHIRKQK